MAPSGLVRVCLEQLPVLQAEESIRATEQIAAGTGSAGEHTRAILQRWLELTTDLTPVSAAARPSTLAAMGISYIETGVPRG